jgi:hypothetical protein
VAAAHRIRVCAPHADNQRNRQPQRRFLFVIVGKDARRDEGNGKRDRTREAERSRREETPTTRVASKGWPLPCSQRGLGEYFALRFLSSDTIGAGRRRQEVRLNRHGRTGHDRNGGDGDRARRRSATAIARRDSLVTRTSHRQSDRTKQRRHHRYSQVHLQSPAQRRGGRMEPRIRRASFITVGSRPTAINAC